MHSCSDTLTDFPFGKNYTEYSLKIVILISFHIYMYGFPYPPPPCFGPYSFDWFCDRVFY